MIDDQVKPAQLAKWAGAELAELVKRIPRVLWRTFVGGVTGFVLGTVIGMALVLVRGAAPWTVGEGWTALVLAAVSLAVFSLGGAYLGALRGCALALATMIDELGWVERLWTQIRPHVQRYASAVRGGANRAEARSAAIARLGELGLKNPEDRLAEKVERFMASIIHLALMKALLRSFVTTIDNEESDWEKIERQGLLLAEELVGDIVARMFHGPAIVALAVTVIAATAPYAVAAYLMA